MRTTLNLDDDVLQDVKHYAESRSLPVGRAVSELVRKGLCTPTPTRTVNGIQVFDLPADSPRITTKRVNEIEFGKAVRRFQERLVGHRQVTDAYLLGLALFKKGRLATLDESVMTLLPEGSPDRGSIEIIRGLS